MKNADIPSGLIERFGFNCLKAFSISNGVNKKEFCSGTGLDGKEGRGVSSEAGVNVEWKNLPKKLEISLGLLVETPGASGLQNVEGKELWSLDLDLI